MGGDLDGAHVVRTYARLTGASIPAAIVAGAAVYGITQALGSGFLGSLAALSSAAASLLARVLRRRTRMRIEEMNAMVGMVRVDAGALSGAQPSTATVCRA